MRSIEMSAKTVEAAVQAACWNSLPVNCSRPSPQKFW